jgi:hypothetical protein
MGQASVGTNERVKHATVRSQLRRFTYVREVALLVLNFVIRNNLADPCRGMDDVLPDPS